MVVISGVINGRNVWRADLSSWFERLQPLVNSRPLWLGSSCSLLHSPIDLNEETRLDAEVKSWFAFALQKCAELALLTQALNAPNDAKLAELAAYSAPIRACRSSSRVHNAQVEQRLAAITSQDIERQLPYEARAETQRKRFNLPAWPTTTIGSFPQTTEIRGLRLDFKQGRLDGKTIAQGSASISNTLLLNRNAWAWTCWFTVKQNVTTWSNTSANADGFVFTQNGWVQSYGSAV